MENYSNTFQHQVAETIQEIDKSNSSLEHKYKTICIALAQHIAEMNDWLKTYTFSSDEEEIHFFKYVRPQIVAQLFHYKTLLKWESKIFIDTELEKQFYLNKQSKLEHKLNNLTYIDNYYKMKSTYNDSMYFVRHNNLIAVGIYTKEYINYDARLCTPKCLAVSKLLSYKMLNEKIKSKFQYGNKGSIKEFKKLKWNCSKQNIYELIFALHHANAVGENGRATLSRIIEAFEIIFDLELKGQAYTRWGHQKNQKKDNVGFLRKITSILENTIETSKNK